MLRTPDFDPGLCRLPDAPRARRRLAAVAWSRPQWHLARKRLARPLPRSRPAHRLESNGRPGLLLFVVGNGKAYTAGHTGEMDTIFCFDAVSGKELWQQSYPAELGDKFFDGGTTGTPTLDGDHLYWLSRWGDLYCFDAASGKIIWNRQLAKETGARVTDWGFSGAPTVYKNLLILNVGEAGMAVDKDSGKEVWKSGEGDAGYNTPLPVTRGDKTEIWFANGEAYLSVAPETGKENWRIKWLTQYGVNAADPIPYGDKVFISSGYNKGAALFEAPAAPDGEPKVIWKNRVLRTQLNGAVLVDKHLYGVDGDANSRAKLKCIEIETGKEIWAQPDFGTGGIIVADGKIIALSAGGELLIAPVSTAGFKPIAHAKILTGKCWTAPVLANGLVYCRNSQGDIVAVDLRKK